MFLKGDRENSIQKNLQSQKKKIARKQALIKRYYKTDSIGLKKNIGPLFEEAFYTQGFLSTAFVKLVKKKAEKAITN